MADVMLLMKAVSSLEKVFWDETVESKKEKSEFFMFDIIPLE